MDEMREYGEYLRKNTGKAANLRCLAGHRAALFWRDNLFKFRFTF